MPLKVYYLTVPREGGTPGNAVSLGKHQVSQETENRNEGKAQVRAVLGFLQERQGRAR